MTFQQTLGYLYERLPMYHRIGAQAYKANLDNTIALCDMLANPQTGFRSIHIAGTNGKGSVSHMMASILQEKGYRTGLYTSPHLKDFRERIRVNGRMIPKRVVTKFIQQYREQFEPIQPSFFELTFGMALDHFREESVDVAVIETGLGGRLDSTNVITPVLSAITNISLDHMQFLGDTVQKIAVEKAGIIKPSVPVVIGETQEETTAIFDQSARESGSEIMYADRRFSSGSFELEQPRNRFRSMDIFRDNVMYLPHLASPLTGLYQRRNILTVMGICEMLNRQGYDLRDAVIRKGIRNVIKNTRLAGRWQILGTNPLTICDTAHNEGGLREVLSQISGTPHQHLHFVIGVVNDKYLDPILKMLPAGATYYFCKPDVPRGLEAEELFRQAIAAGLSGSAYPTVSKALEAARKAAKREDLVFIGGSTFVVAEAENVHPPEIR